MAKKCDICGEQVCGGCFANLCGVICPVYVKNNVHDEWGLGFVQVAGTAEGAGKVRREKMTGKKRMGKSQVLPILFFPVIFDRTVIEPQGPSGKFFLLRKRREGKLKGNCTPIN